MNIFDLVPEIYFDIISRIIPGFLSLTLLEITLRFQSNNSILDVILNPNIFLESKLLPFFLYVTAAYIAGNFLEVTSRLVERVLKIYRRKTRVINKILTQENYFPSEIKIFIQTEIQKNIINKEIDIAKLTSRSYLNLIYLWFDWLKVRHSNVTASLIKIFAEYQMHRNNSTGLILIFLLYFLLDLLNGQGLNILGICLLAASALVSLKATSNAFEIFENSVINHYYSLHRKNLP